MFKFSALESHLAPKTTVALRSLTSRVFTESFTMGFPDV